jgi:hypothetical protein
VSIHILTQDEANAFVCQGVLSNCRAHSHIGRRKADELVKDGEARYFGSRSVLVFCSVKSPQIVSDKEGTGVQWVSWGSTRWSLEKSKTRGARKRVKLAPPRFWTRIGMELVEISQQEMKR